VDWTSRFFATIEWKLNAKGINIISYVSTAKRTRRLEREKDYIAERRGVNSTRP
jgi:hypothetical protein